MKKIILLALSLISSTVFAAGFEAGNEFVATPLEGSISVTCNDFSTGERDFGTFICRDEILQPGEVLRFQGDVGVDADEVSLTAKWEDGSTRTKTKDYDPATGMSKGRFNLWIQTLLQRPLLDYGKNEINFQLTKDSTPVQEGSFIANVAKGAKRTCSVREHFFSNTIRDCRFPDDLCRRYFSMHNYCR